MHQLKQWLTFRKTMSFVGLIGLFAAALLSPLDAQSFVRGFESEQSLERGTIVVIDDDDNDKVMPATLERVDDLYGVVVNPTDAALTISGETEQVFVATSGRYRVLVSTQNDSINRGDFVTISSIQGVGMKVDDAIPIIIGRALESFDGSDRVGSSQVGESTVQIGRIDVDVQVAGNPLQRPTEATLPDFLRQAAEFIAQEPVSAERIYAATFIFIVTIVVAGSLMYSGVRNSIISIGRNPLSKKSIVKGMLQVIFFGLIVVVLGLFAVYLILTVG